MKLAAIDIGSNAVRLLIEQVQQTGDSYRIEKVSFFRIPLRLGAEVFEHGGISERKESQLIKTMKAFWYLMDVHEVENYRAVATSAMREAENSQSVCKHIKKQANIKIEVISGDDEANLIVNNILTTKLEPNGNYFYIDVGGGSTEVTLIKKGKRKQSKSFPIGTIRMLKGKVNKKKWVQARTWIQEAFEPEKPNFIAVGTGGNINKIFKEIGKKPNERITASEIEKTYNYLREFSYDERIVKLGMRPDRADVILPAAEIYYNFMKFAGVQEMNVPRIGLSDGVVLSLFEEWKEQVR